MSHPSNIIYKHKEILLSSKVNQIDKINYIYIYKLL